jgi:hypothetical protein
MKWARQVGHVAFDDMVLVTQQSGLADEAFAISSWQLGVFFFSGKLSSIFYKEIGEILEILVFKV